MKIEIDYNGSCVVCKVDGKHILQCDSLTMAMALSLFRCIYQQIRREAQKEKKYERPPGFYRPYD